MQPAQADTCAVVACVEDVTGFYYVGRVADALERPVIGATVSDTRKSVSTNGDGEYRISERDWNTLDDGYTSYVNAKAQGMAGRTKYQNQGAASQDVRVDFTLMYLARSSTDPATSRSGPFAPRGSTVVYTVRSFAPAPDTVCVPVRIEDNDQALGTAQFVGTDDSGESTWTLAFMVPDVPWIGFSVEAMVTDCASGVELTHRTSTNLYVS